MIETEKQIIEKVFARDFCMIALQIPMQYENALSKPWQEITNPYTPYLIIERTDGTSHIYFNRKGVEYTIKTLKSKAESNPRFLINVEQKVREGIQFIRPIYEKEEILSREDLLRFIIEFENSYNWIEAMWWLKSIPQNETSVDLAKIVTLREETEKLSAGTEIVIRKSLQNLYPELGELASMITLKEFTLNSLPERSELEKRIKGFVLLGDQIIFGKSIQEVANSLGIQIKTDEEGNSNDIKGQVAYPGKATGTVCRVMGHTHFSKMKQGMILVSPMTMVDFLPLMKIAGAIVTDEGGITCHAAIVARELKKPCIIGTKIATKVLKDGDMVEVDAESGIINIIKSNNI